MMRLPFRLQSLGPSGIAGSIVPTVGRDNAWRATLAGLIVLLCWQLLAAATAAVAYFQRTVGQPCGLGPLCQRIDGWSDGRVALAALAILTASLFLLIAVGRVTLALWRRRFWAGIAARIAGWMVAVGGLLLVLVGGLVWLVLGAWIAYWAGRLAYDAPAWVQQVGGPPGPPPAPVEEIVIEGERV